MSHRDGETYILMPWALQKTSLTIPQHELLVTRYDIVLWDSEGLFEGIDTVRAETGPGC